MYPLHEVDARNIYLHFQHAVRNRLEVDKFQNKSRKISNAIMHVPNPLVKSQRQKHSVLFLVVFFFSIEDTLFTLIL